MPQLITINRATLEQLVADILEINRAIGNGGSASSISSRACPAIRRSLTTLRAALANAEPKKVEKVKKREPTIDLGKYAGTYGGYITKDTP